MRTHLETLLNQLLADDPAVVPGKHAELASRIATALDIERDDRRALLLVEVRR